MKKWIRFIFTKSFVKTVLFSVLACVLVVFTALFWINSSTQHGNYVEVPDMRALTLEEALQQLDSLELRYEVIDSSRYRPNFPKNSIVEHFPAGAAQVKPGRIILLTVNPPSLPKYPLPNFQDQLLSYVVNKFEAKGFKVDSVRMIPDASHDLVMRVFDEDGVEATSGELYQVGASFVFEVSAGYGSAASYLPNLFALSFAEAKSTLQGASLNMGAAVYPDGIDSAAAFVVSQRPEFEKGTTLLPGSSVDVWFTDDSSLIPVKVEVDTTRTEEQPATL